jgi:ATP-dependent RNA helicase DHX57
VLIRELRKELDKLMAAKIQNPAVDISASPVVTALLRLVSSDGSDMSERLGSA